MRARNLVSVGLCLGSCKRVQHRGDEVAHVNPFISSCWCFGAPRTPEAFCLCAKLCVAVTRLGARVSRLSAPLSTFLREYRPGERRNGKSRFELLCDSTFAPLHQARPTQCYAPQHDLLQLRKQAECVFFDFSTRFGIVSSVSPLSWKQHSPSEFSPSGKVTRLIFVHSRTRLSRSVVPS